MRRAALVLACAAGLACASAYQRTYDQTYQQLETKADAERKAEEAAHAEAQKFASVVYFETGSAVIQEEGYKDIAWFVQQMQPYPKAILEVRGFADATGSEAKNQQLSDQRAEAVANALAMQGIDSSRIRKLGYGASFQAATNTTAQGRRDNRRVEITVE
jgi:outer membrane protein OmpA-like peptidoglycan-associated protein